MRRRSSPGSSLARRTWTTAHRSEGRVALGLWLWLRPSPNPSPNPSPSPTPNPNQVAVVPLHERLGHCGEAGANVRLVCGDPNPNRLTLTPTPTPTLTLTLTPQPPNPNLTLTPTDSMTLTPPAIQARVRRPVRGGRGGGQGGEQGTGRAPRGDAPHRCGGGPHARLLPGSLDLA